MLKYFAALTAVVIGFYYGSELAFDDLSSHSLTLQQLWHDDIQNLTHNKILPTAINNIREIEWITPDSQSRTWARYARPPFELKPTGQYRLELLVLAQHENELLAVIQHHLIHIPTGNSVWELGRTYTLSSP